MNDAGTDSDSTARTIVLASASKIRLRLLQAAGVPATAQRAGVDEDEVKLSLRAVDATPPQVAETLAELKAQRVSVRWPGSLVLGADQVLACDDVLFDKPSDLQAAAVQLRQLRGRRHELVSSIVAVRDGARLWHATDRARLTMRSFSDAFLDAYLRDCGDAALESVGAYQLEGRGAQLFSRVDGDYFTVLGLPLLPLLDFLRAQGLLDT